MAEIGFKEWAMVCEELGRGTQSIILRKGGIHEGAKGFRFEHSEFWLFPTGFHEQAGQLKGDRGPIPEDSSSGEEGGEVGLRYRATLEWARVLESWEQVEALSGHHCWQEEILRERFIYTGEEGIWCAFLRVSAPPEPWRLADRPGFGGCRSWLKLPEDEGSAPSGLRPVLDDAAHAERAAQLERLLA